jgi:uncharacterized LabA/DUF88 family protein
MTALIVDGAALTIGIRAHGALHVIRFLRWVEDNFGPTVVRYWFDATPNARPTALHDAAGAARFEVFLYRSMPQYDRGTHATRFKQMGVDVGLAVAAVASLERDRWKRLVLITGDGNFCPLVTYVRDAGADVMLVGNLGTTNAELVQRASHHHDLRDIAPHVIVPGTTLRPAA